MVKIRLAQSTDGDTLFVLAQSFATSFVVQEQAFRRSFLQLLDSSEAYLAVAELQEQVIGYVLGFDHATLYANGRVGWVEELMVDASSRRQGIGQQLMREFEGWARGRDCQLVALATRRAAPFYHSIGYEESATYFRKRL